MYVLHQMTQKKQHGLTLLELLIAMLIGTLLILGATSMFIANKRVYKEVDYQGRLAENARFGMEMMIRDLRMVGFMGCSVQQEVINNLNLGATNPERELLSYLTKNSSDCNADITSTTCIQANSIEGAEVDASGNVNWQPSQSTEPTDANLTLVAGTDAFSVRFFEDTQTNLCKDMISADSVLEVNNQGSTPIAAGTFIEGAVFAASDCEATNIFQLTADATTPGSGASATEAGTGPFELAHASGSLTPGNSVSTLSKIYISGTVCAASPVDIFIFRARRYFVATDTNVQNGLPALYRQTFEFNAANAAATTPEVFSERLIDGVENMQILYGEDTSGNRVADAYRVAGAVVNWANVVSVKLAVLFATVEQDFTAPEDTKSDYQLLDAAAFDPTTGANDHRRRKIVEATVALRNRQL